MVTKKTQTKKKTINQIDYWRLEELIQKEFKLKSRYNIIWAEECSNDSYLHFELTGKHETWEVKDPDSFDFAQVAGKQYNTHLLCQELCRRGILEKGTLVVSVCW